MKVYACSKCGAPPTNIRMTEDKEAGTITYPCLYHAITSPSGQPCDGTIIVDKRDVFAAKIAQEDCRT